MKVEKQQHDELGRVAELVKQIKVCMLTTADDTGALRSRPMQTLELDAQSRAWFFMSGSAPKVHEMYANSREVNLSYANPEKYNFLSLTGAASIVRDRARMKSLWTPYAKLWFPNGLDDPDLVLLCVEIDKAEYWDAPGSAVRRVVGFAKALATGR